MAMERDQIARPHLADLWIDLLTDLCDQNVDEWPLADDDATVRAACILCDDRPDTYAWHTPDGPAHTWHWIQDVLPHMLECDPLKPGVQSVRIHGWEVAQLTAVNGEVIVRTIDGRLRHATESTWINELLRIWGMA